MGSAYRVLSTHTVQTAKYERKFTKRHEDIHWPGSAEIQDPTERFGGHVIFRRVPVDLVLKKHWINAGSKSGSLEKESLVDL